MRRLLGGVAAVVLLAGCGSTPSSQGPLPSHTATPTTPVPAAISAGVELNRSPVVPRHFTLGVIDAAVIPLELQGNALTPPADPKVLGWWGSKAGAEQGTTLLVGHTVHTGGGALDNLEDVPVGSDLQVSGVSYSVASNHVISKADLARKATALFSQSGPHRLVVVTCEDYDPETGHYASNVVLIANQKGTK